MTATIQAQTTAAPPPGSAAWQQAVAALHAALWQSHYEDCQWIPTHRRLLAAAFEPRNMWRFVVHSHPQLMETSALPGLYRKLLRIRHPLAERSLAFFGLEQSLARDELARLLSDLGQPAEIEELAELKIVRPTSDGRLECLLRFVPHGRLIFVADRYDRTIPDFAYLGRDSLRMATWLQKVLAGRQIRRGLDICCGTGMQGLTLAQFAQSVEGADINPRSVAFANLNAQWNDLQDRVHFSQANLAVDCHGPFDVVVSNPPYVFMPSEDAATNRDGCGGGLFGLELTGRILSDLERLLGENGEAHLVLTTPVVGGKSILEPLVAERLAGTNLGAEVTYLDYRFESTYAAYHRAHGINYVINCFLTIGRNLPPGVRVIHLNPISRIVNRLYVATKNLGK